MSTNSQASFLKSALTGLGDYFDWIKEMLSYQETRQEVLLNLGLDPSKEVEASVPSDSLDNIDKYRNSVDADDEAFHSAVNDIGALYASIKDYLSAFIDDPTRLDEILWLFFQIMTTNYVRLKYPRTYWILQLGGFLVDFSRITDDQIKEGAKTIVEVSLKNLWDFISNPLFYPFKLLGKLAEVLPGLETTENAKSWSHLFYLLSGLFAAREVLGEGGGIRYLSGWDVLPNEWTTESHQQLKESFHGEHLLDKIREKYEEEYPLDEDNDAAWDTVESTLAKTSPTAIEKEIIAAYNLTKKRWQKGTWYDVISENAFSFDVQLSDDPNVEKYLGGTVFFISKEDAPSDLNDEESGINYILSGGLFASLNGELNIKKPLDDNWDLAFETSSGNLLDIYLDLLADINILGDMQIKTSLKRKVDPQTGASYALPDTTGNRFQVGEINITGFFSKQDLGLEIGLKDNALVLSGKGTDGFLKEILPASDLPLKFSLVAGISKKKGLYIHHDVGLINDLLGTDENAANARGAQARGGEAVEEKEEKVEVEKTALEKLFPIHKDMGVLKFESVKWSYGPSIKEKSFGVKLQVLSTFSSKLGPLFLKVDKAGFGMELSMPKENIDLSAIEYTFGFKPPKGVAIRIDSEVVSGGGFLELDYDNHRYAGVLALSFQSIELSAIGLINTRLPNNEEGFSMLIAINVLFQPGIQLSFGFTLEGVGGLIGIHRTMKVDVLRERIQKGAITSIMFPKDVIENAPKIISDLRAVFPPKKNYFVIAPFLKIGWGSPAMIEIDLGVLVEIPFRKRLILIGHVGVYLPKKEMDKPLVEIHIDIFGDFNFAESYILVEGRLRDSQVVGIPLTGGFAFLLDWGPESKFLFSIGGYHPRYKKPARFPAIPRLKAIIKRGSGFSLTCELYQAITSNSFQIGFQADLLIKYGSVSISGFLGFNALLQWDPFYFETDIHISVALKYKSRNLAGVDLSFLLSGPGPWKAKGYAKIKILFFSLKVRFNVEWGDEQQAIPSSVGANQLLLNLRDQLEETRSWAGILPPGFNTPEPLRALDESEKQGLLLVHPISNLEIRQRLLPLDKTIEKLGNSFVQGLPAYKISTYKLGTQAKKTITDNDSKFKSVFEQFSRGQFEVIPDSKKLSTPDFDLMPAGLTLAANKAYDFAVSKRSATTDFEDIILGAAETIREREQGDNWQQRSWLSLNKKQRFRDTAKETFKLIEELPDFQDKGYKIVSKNDLQAPSSLTENYFTTYSKAEEYLQTRLEKWTEWQILSAEPK